MAEVNIPRGRIVGLSDKWPTVQLLLTGVAVEKVAFGENSHRFGDRKCPPESRKSLGGHPSAMKFLSGAARGRLGGNGSHLTA
jgi:hypothetical protein